MKNWFTSGFISLALVGVVGAAVGVNDPGEAATNRPGILVPAPTGGPGAVPKAPVEDVLKFRNADLLHGTLLGISAADGLRWSRTDSKAPLVFALDNLAEVQFGAPPVPRAGTQSRVRLTNGDSLAGELVALTADTLQLQTWYAGSVTLKRPMVAAIQPNIALSLVLYAGPNSLQEWQVPRGSSNPWQFRKDALVALGNNSSVIYRDVKMADLASIDVEVAWQGYPQFSLFFYGDNVQNYYNLDGYALAVGGTSVYLQRGRGNNGMQAVDNNSTDLRQLQGKSKAVFGLRVNRTTRTFALLLDGKLVKQWTDPDEFTGSGTKVGFVTQGQPLRVSQIRVAAWDGQLQTDTGGKAVADEDYVRLANGDKLTGKLAGIKDGRIAFQTSFAEMNIPLERAAEITLSAKTAAKPRRQATDVQAMFADGGQMTLALEQVDGQSLIGTSEHCGRLTIQRTAFNRLVLNIYAPRTDDDEDEWAAPKATSGRGRGRVLVE